jgi:hypothetical protein
MRLRHLINEISWKVPVDGLTPKNLFKALTHYDTKYCNPTSRFVIVADVPKNDMSVSVPFLAHSVLTS